MTEAENASTRGNLSTLYKITRPSAPVLGKSGRNITTEHQEAARWVEHFRDVLNQPDPDEPANPSPAADILNIDVGVPTAEEVIKIIKAMKTSKAAGVDSNHAEMLKADLLTSTKA